jgi:hypothetical protein
MIRYVQIFGERCSGTNFLTSLVYKNFRDIELTREFGGKHWFIRDHKPRPPGNNSTDFQSKRSLKNSDDTLFLVIYRNPFDWLRSLHRKPYHAPEHWGLNFSDFIRKKWISYETSRLNKDWPEAKDDYYFIEEAENILQLRTQKIRHLNQLETVVRNLCFVNHEVIANRVDLLGKIADQFKIELKHPVIQGENRYLSGHATKANHFAAKAYPAIGEEDLEFLQLNLDWKIENSIGYTFGNPD